MDPTVKAELEQLATTTDIKVFLARRQDRKQLNGSRYVWWMHRVGRNVAAGHIEIAEDAPVMLPEVSLPDGARPDDTFPDDTFPGTSLPGTTSSSVERGTQPGGEDLTQTGRQRLNPDPTRTESSIADPGILPPILFVCTNGARDRCCAVEGRELVKRLSLDVWEISHLGGHRFAPTALRFPDGLLFGRLNPTSARELVSMANPGPSHTRGRFGRNPWQQVAELSVADKTGILLHDLDSSGEPGNTTVSDSRGTTWEVSLSQRELAPRRVSCDKEPGTDRVWVPTVVSSA